MRFDRFTDHARDALSAAQTVAVDMGHGAVDTGHLLLGICRQDAGLAPALFAALKVSRQSLRGDVTGELDRLRRRPDKAGPVPFSEALESVVVAAFDDADDGAVGLEHLLVALGSDRAGAAGRVFARHGLTPQLITASVRAAPGRPAPADTKAAVPAGLAPFGRDLVAEARAGRLEPVIGRGDEIRRVIRLLSRKTKNNPVLIGEPGVGKTAVVEGLAALIARGEVPDDLKNRSVFALDVSSMVAGTRYRGDFEERFRSVLDGVAKAGGRTILFVDELHTVVGAGAGDGPLDAGNMLKPALARGEVHCIGATTLDEYRRHIEKDGALSRRFQPVYVGEPDAEEAITILRGLKGRFEDHHGVRVQDAAVVAAVRLASRYVPERFLPDKAIDLLDEACATLRTENDSMPAALEDVGKRMMRLEVERSALRDDPGGAARLRHVERELGEVREEHAAVRVRWEAGREWLGSVRGARERLSEATERLAAAERAYDVRTAGELRHRVIPALTGALDALIADPPRAADGRPVSEQVTPDGVAAVVSRWTDVPVTKLLTAEREKLLGLEARLRERVIGQDEATAAAARAVLRARTGVSDPGRPDGTFLFLGPTGVGKTELAKALADVLFDGEDRLVRLDMSEFSERHTVSGLIGAPPGYVGFDQAGRLTEPVRRRPYSVVLLDEIEKAHPDLFGVLLQVLDDGRLTDSRGRTVDFRNTVIVMTSNVGATAPPGPAGDAAVRAELRAKFRPEFLNRLDAVVRFSPLGPAEVRRVAAKIVAETAARLAENGVTLETSEDALSFVAAESFDPEYGARPVRRYVEQELGDLVAAELAARGPEEGCVLFVHVKEGRLACVRHGG